MIATLAELLLNTVKTYPKENFMLVKKGGAYTSISTAVFGENVRHISLGFYSLGFRKGDKLCLLSENRP